MHHNIYIFYTNKAGENIERCINNPSLNTPLSYVVTKRKGCDRHGHMGRWECIETLHSSFDCSIIQFWPLNHGLWPWCSLMKPNLNKHGRGKYLPYSPWWYNFQHELKPINPSTSQGSAQPTKCINTRPRGPLTHVIQIYVFGRKSKEGPRTSLYTRFWRPRGI